MTPAKIRIKLKAYTLIEGIVSMVILSLLLSIAVLISFNLYRSFPAERELAMKSVLHAESDSLVALKWEEDVHYSVRGYMVSYTVEKYADFARIRMAECLVEDSLGHRQTTKKLFYVEEKEEE